MSSAANVLTSSPKICHVHKRDSFHIYFALINEYDRSGHADFNNAWARLSYCLWKHNVKQNFLDIYLTTFSEFVISKIQNLWESSLFSKCSKFKLDLENRAKNGEKLLCSWDNCIWICIVKLSLLRTGYFSSATYVLTSSPNIWPVNKRDFFELNWLGCDQLIW